MPKTHKQALEFSRVEVKEISVALMDQIDTLAALDAAAYGKPIERSRAALAKALVMVGQAQGEKCFLCRKPIVLETETRALYCASGCPSPAVYLRNLGHAR